MSIRRLARPTTFLLASKAQQVDVRFTPESGHPAMILECPLSANSGHGC